MDASTGTFTSVEAQPQPSPPTTKQQLSSFYCSDISLVTNPMLRKATIETETAKQTKVLSQTTGA